MLLAIHGYGKSTRMAYFVLLLLGLQVGTLSPPITPHLASIGVVTRQDSLPSTPRQSTRLDLSSKANKAKPTRKRMGRILLSILIALTLLAAILYFLTLVVLTFARCR